MAFGARSANDTTPADDVTELNDEFDARVANIARRAYAEGRDNLEFR